MLLIQPIVKQSLLKLIIALIAFSRLPNFVLPLFVKVLITIASIELVVAIATAIVPPFVELVRPFKLLRPLLLRPLFSNSPFAINVLTSYSHNDHLPLVQI